MRSSVSPMRMSSVASILWAALDLKTQTNATDYVQLDANGQVDSRQSIPHLYFTLKLCYLNIY